MKKKLASSVFIICLILVSGPVLAAPFDVDVSPENITVESGDVAIFDITIHNNLAKEVSFAFDVIGPHLTWIKEPRVLEFDEYGSMMRTISIEPVGENPGIYNYNVTVSAIDYSFEVVKNFTLKVVNPVDIQSMFISNTPEKLNIYLNLISIKRHRGNAVFNIIDSNNRIAKSETVPFTIDGEKIILVKVLSLDDLLAGDYSIEARIEGTGITTSRNFTIEAVHNVQKTTDVQENFLGREITVTVTNNGNIIEYDYPISEETQGVTGLVIMPTDCYDAGGKKTVCASNIDRLEPGENESITYRIGYWPTHASWVAGVVAAIIVFLFGFNRVTAPKIKKKHVSSTKDNTHTVALEIKNPFSKKNLNNVIVRDWVSPLAKVMHNSFESLRPVIRRTEAGTELIWKLGDIIGKEERVITYKIKGFVGGELKMPRAYLRYRDDKGKGFRVFSKGVVIS